VAEAERRVRRALRQDLPEIVEKIHAGDDLSDEDRTHLLELAKQAIAPLRKE
jgi:gluconate kinase